MKYFFIVLGYGVPRDIMEDLNYSIYLRGVLGRIFDLIGNTGDNQGTVFFCGARTDFFPPYRRNEATEMRKLFRHLLNRDVLRGLTSRLKLSQDKCSFSALESLRSAANVIQDLYGEWRIIVFCEHTRTGRILKLAQHIFNAMGYGVRVIPIDFDQSDLRYHDREAIEQRERGETEYALNALGSSELYEIYLKASRRRVSMLRKKAKERPGGGVHPFHLAGHRAAK